MMGVSEEEWAGLVDEARAQEQAEEEWQAEEEVPRDRWKQSVYPVLLIACAVILGIPTTFLSLIGWSLWFGGLYRYLRSYVDHRRGALWAVGLSYPSIIVLVAWSLPVVNPDEMMFGVFLMVVGVAFILLRYGQKGSRAMTAATATWLCAAMLGMTAVAYMWVEANVRMQ